MSLEQNQLFIQHLQQAGRINTPSIVEAFRAIDRADFVPLDYRGAAYLDEPVPIGEGMTTSQPSTIAFMLEKLQAQAAQKVLEIGTGSGYLTALLAKIVGPTGRVYSIEYFPNLKEFAENNLEKYNFTNIELLGGDGKMGLPDQAPFDLIVSSAEAKKIPPAWKKQLKIGGKILTPFDSSIKLMAKISDQKFEEKIFPLFYFIKLK